MVQDVVFTDEMAHFDRERIPERVVHAKGAGESCVHLLSKDCFRTPGLKMISRFIQVPNLHPWEKGKSVHQNRN